MPIYLGFRHSHFRRMPDHVCECRTVWLPRWLPTFSTSGPTTLSDHTTPAVVTTLLRTRSGYVSDQATTPDSCSWRTWSSVNPASLSTALVCAPKPGGGLVALEDRSPVDRSNRIGFASTRRSVPSRLIMLPRWVTCGSSTRSAASLTGPTPPSRPGVASHSTDVFVENSVSRRARSCESSLPPTR